MNTNKSIETSSRRFLAIFLSLCLLLPGVTMADGKNGKKNFKEGLKYEQLQQWDMAAQRFALALSAEPNNPEYKVHYLQALQRASLMYITRGDALADQNDYSGAYVAYRQAFNFDPGNEIAKFKMERMLELQKAQVSGTSEQIKYNTKTGAVTPVSREIQVANKPRSREDLPMNVNLVGLPLKHTLKSLAEPLKLNVVFDDAIADNLRVTISMDNVTPARAIDIILMQKKLAFEQVDRRTIFIYPDNNPGNRSRFEKLLIKTFYLNNISALTAKNVLAQMLPPGRQAAAVDTVGGSGGGGGDSNVLIVKATPAELQLVQDLLSNIDKNKNEVVLDIEIYEVSNDSLVQIGNQFVTSPIDITTTLRDNEGKPSGTTTIRSPSLSNLGGIGLGRLPTGDTGIAGNFLTPFLGGIGTLFGLPPSQLSLLQSKGKSKLLHKTQIHVLDRGENETKVGRSVPVRLGTQFGNGINFGGLNGINNGNNNGGIAQNIGNALAGLSGAGGFGGGFDSIQYRDVGLVIKAKPTITNEGYVEIKMNFESSDVVASGADAQNLTPTFTQRSLSTVARIQDGVTAVVAGVNQDAKGDSRAGIPVLGMLPLIGRLFATPRQESRQTDVIITVTPHIVRSAGITADDHLARIGPPQAGGMNQSIEDVVNRAQVEDEQEQRLIAERQSPGASGVSAPTSQPANFNNQQRPGASQPFTYNAPPATGSQTTVQPVNNPNNRGAIGGFPPRSSNPVSDGPPPVPERRESETAADPEDDGQPRPESNGEEAAPEETTAATLRSENVDLAVARMLAVERARKGVESANNANSTSGGESANNANSPVNFSISPKPIRERLGKTFTVTVEVSGEQQMSGADIALKYDATKLQVKSVRDGGLFGSRPAFTYDYNKQGVLTVSVEHPQSAPTATSGRLVTVEFSAIGEGQSEIALSGGQTKARVGNAQIPVAGSSTQVIIARGSTSGSNDK